MYIKRNRQQVLMELDKRVFRTSDLAVLWGIEKKTTLLMTVSRYVKQGILFRIKKGVYSTVSLNKLHPYELGCALAGPLSYISTETILVNEGVMMQGLDKITLMGKKAGEWQILGRYYWCRYLKPSKLVDRRGIKDGVRFSIARLERAKQDLRWVNPKIYLDRRCK